MPTTTGKATDFITFSRASLATVTDSDGKIKWAPHNLLTNSESFDAAAWAKVASSITANSTVAPNGTTTADTYKEDNTLSQHQITQSTPIPVGLNAVRVYAKLGSGSRYLQMRPSGLGTGVAYANFDLSTGVVVPSGTGGTAFVSASVTPSSNSFYLCEMVVNFTSAAPGIMFQLSNGTGENTAYTGDNTSSIILWGAHVYRSDLGGMVANTSAYPMYNPTTPKNLLGYSEAFDNAAWTKSGILAFGSGSVANAITAPNGFLSADKIVEDTANGGHSVYAAVSVTSGTTYTMSCYAKKAERDFVWLKFADGAANWGTCFNLNTGTVGSTVSGFSAPNSAAISSVGDGWYRCSIVVTAGASGSGGQDIGVTSTDGTRVYTGDGTSGIYLWGAQLSDSASLNPYVANAFAAPTAAAYHGPRLDFDPVTQAARGLLVEEQRTNLLLRSEEFNAANWAKVNTTVSQNAALSPSGQTSADKLVESSATSIHTLYQTVTTGSAANTFSIYLKAAERSRVVLAMSDNTTGEASIGVDLSTGTTFASGIAVGSWTSASSTVTAVGNGWYRVALTATRGAGTQTLPTIYLVSSGTTISYAGDGTSGVLLYGAQLEAGSFPTSLIVTGASTVSRAADVASVATSQFPYSASEGTIVAAYSPLSTSGANRGVFSLNDGTNNNYADWRPNGSQMLVVAGAATSADLYPGGGTVGAVSKGALAIKANDFAACVNGGTVQTDTSGAVPIGVDRLLIGYLANNPANAICGHIRQITYIPRRLTNAELQARTA